MKAILTATTGALIALAATLASAQTLYKLIDKNGKITYSESAPKPGEFDGQVIRIDVDPNRNTATLPKPKETDKGFKEREGESNNREAKAARKLAPPDEASAREKLDAAKKALADAQENPPEGAMNRIGTKSGGARAVPTDEYRARLERLEANVKAAEEDLARAQGR